MSKITYQTWHDVNDTFTFDDETKGALNVIQWAYDHYGEELVYACSFGVEGIVMLDFISQINETAKVVFLDTGLHFKETYDLIEQVRQRYPRLKIEMKQPSLTVQEQAQTHGDRLWETQPDRCCHLRKVVPLRETLNHATAWLSGLRREQSPSRRKTNFINKDDIFQSIKICPLIHWSWLDIWDYVKERQLPYNELHCQGYSSIGCAPCTSKADDSEAGTRSGRWANHKKTECGLHYKNYT